MQVYSDMIRDVLDDSFKLKSTKLFEYFMSLKKPIEDSEISISIHWFNNKHLPLEMINNNVLNLINTMVQSGFIKSNDSQYLTKISNYNFITEDQQFLTIAIDNNSSELSETESKIYKIGCMLDEILEPNVSLKPLKDYLLHIKEDTKKSNKLHLMHSYATDRINEIEKERG